MGPPATGQVPTGRLCRDYPLLSLTRAAGVLSWKTVRVLWQYWCDVRFWSEVPDLSAFLRILHAELAKWPVAPELSLNHQAVHLYMEGIQGLLSNRDIPVQPGSAMDMLKRPVLGGRRDSCPLWPSLIAGIKWVRSGRVPRRRWTANRAAAIYHRFFFFTDGSYAEEAPGLGFAGYGVWFGFLDPQNVLCPLGGLTQTNNRAELSAAIAALRTVPAAQPIV